MTLDMVVDNLRVAPIRTRKVENVETVSRVGSSLLYTCAENDWMNVLRAYANVRLNPTQPDGSKLFGKSSLDLLTYVLYHQIKQHGDTKRTSGRYYSSHTIDVAMLGIRIYQEFSTAYKKAVKQKKPVSDPAIRDFEFIETNYDMLEETITALMHDEEEETGISVNKIKNNLKTYVQLYAKTRIREEEERQKYLDQHLGTTGDGLSGTIGRVISGLKAHHTMGAEYYGQTIPLIKYARPGPLFGKHNDGTSNVNEMKDRYGSKVIFKNLLQTIVKFTNKYFMFTLGKYLHHNKNFKEWYHQKMRSDNFNGADVIYRLFKNFIHIEAGARRQNYRLKYMGKSDEATRGAVYDPLLMRAREIELETTIKRLQPHKKHLLMYHCSGFDEGRVEWSTSIPSVKLVNEDKPYASHASQIKQDYYTKVQNDFQVIRDGNTTTLGFNQFLDEFFSPKIRYVEPLEILEWFDTQVNGKILTEEMVQSLAKRYGMPEEDLVDHSSSLIGKIFKGNIFDYEKKCVDPWLLEADTAEIGGTYLRLKKRFYDRTLIFKWKESVGDENSPDDVFDVFDKIFIDMSLPVHAKLGTLYKRTELNPERDYIDYLNDYFNILSDDMDRFVARDKKRRTIRPRKRRQYVMTSLFEALLYYMKEDDTSFDRLSQPEQYMRTFKWHKNDTPWTVKKHSYGEDKTLYEK